MVVKRAAFCLVVVFLLASCGCGFFGGWDDTVITNNSDRSVTFKFYQTGEFTLAQGGSISFEPRADLDLERFSYYGQELPDYPARVRFVRFFTPYGWSGEFILVCMCEDDDCDTFACGNAAEAICDFSCDCDFREDETPAPEAD